MHGILLGVVRQLLRLWFDSKYSSQHFSCNKLVDVVDERLVNIKPPNHISRLPRSVKHHAAYWKANECRAWLLYYSIPVLCGILPHEYYQHHILLAEAVHILCQENIHQLDLVHCRRVLIHDVSTFGALYSDRHMTINVHQLIHLVDVVQKLGPLWVYSCFSFESLNGKLLRLVHGANKPVLQIANAVTTMLRMPELGEKLTPNSKVASLYNHLRGGDSKLSSVVAIEPNIYIVGKLMSNSNQEYQAALQRAGFVAESMFSFLRLRVNGSLVCYSQYIALKSRVSSIVVLHDGSFALVEVFLKCCTCKCSESCICGSSRPKYVAMVKKLHVAKCDDIGLCCDDLTGVSLPNFRLIHSRASQSVAIPVSSLREVCVYIRVQMIEENLPDMEFIVVPPNHLEGD